MTAARKIADLTEDEFVALLRAELGREAKPKPVEPRAAIDREPPPEAYARLMARRRRKGQR